MRTKEGCDTTRERIVLTSEKFQVRGLKKDSCEARTSELHTWLARGIIAAAVILGPSQQSARQEDQFEEFPHDATGKSSL